MIGILLSVISIMTIVGRAEAMPIGSGTNCKRWSHDNSITCSTPQGTWEGRNWSHDNTTTWTGPNGQSVECKHWSHDNTTTCY